MNAATKVDVDEAGERVYRQFTPAEQQRLRESVMRETAAGASPSSTTANRQHQGGGGKSWQAVVEAEVNAAVERRLSAGLDCSAPAIVDDVMPAALAAVPEHVRAALMLEVQQMLGLQEAELSVVA